MNLPCGCPRSVLTIEEGWRVEDGHPSSVMAEKHKHHKGLVRLAASTDRAKKLSRLSDKMLADLFLSKVWGNLVVYTEESDIAAELHSRFENMVKRLEEYDMPSHKD